ncbi:MAG: recD, partial [Clostridia bacterium]|nr:recD [Clostridia bacterium]
MDEVQGSIYDVVFRNEQNGYSVVELECEKSLVTVVGYFAYVNIGETIKIYGSWVQHPDYGKQFKMETYDNVTPSTLYGIEKYLASGLIAGIGPHTAKKMVERFGVDTLDIIQYNPDRLSEVEGVGAKKAAKIYEAFQEQKELKDIMMFLEQYDISPTYAVKIFKAYGANTIAVVKENPYKLSDDIAGIGFKMSDRIALSMGISIDSEFRITSATKYCLNWFHGNGHSYAPQEELCRVTSELLGVDEEVIQENIVKLFINKNLVVESLGDIRAVYATSFHKAESGVARRLLQMSMHNLSKLDVNFDEELQKLEQSQGITLADNQKSAVREAMNNGVLVVTGGPGTGKTTTIKTIIDLLERKGMSVLLAAPTGRAAKRMQEATGKEAKTLHRLLEFGFGDGDEEMYFQKSEESPLECDAIIVDEVSMIDIMLMNYLLKAVVEGTRLILVGDVDQLPSVGPG